MKKTLVSSSLLLALFLLVGAGCTPQTTDRPQETTQASPTAETPTVPDNKLPVKKEEVKTDDWKTYQNSVYNFSVEHPGNWPVNDKQTECGNTNGLTICEIPIGLPVMSPSGSDTHVNILIHSKAVLANSDGSDGLSPCSKHKMLTLSNGLKAERKECEGIDGRQLDVFTIDQNGIKYQLIHDIGSPEVTTVFERMANSFKLY